MAQDFHARRNGYFELRGQADAEQFFRALPDLVPDASTLFIEAGGPAADIVAVYEAHAEEGPFLPKRQTIWPKASTFRLAFSTQTLDSLSALAAERAAPEYVDHFSVFDGETAVLHYPDSFLPGAVIYVSRSISQERLQTWALQLGLQLREAAV